MATRKFSYAEFMIDHPAPRTQQMATRTKNIWKAMIVLGCDHAGLKSHFQRLENEMRQALSQLYDPRDVALYLDCLRDWSQNWLRDHAERQAKK
jgi:hypothetical protein